VITKKTITSAVAAGWISFPEPKERQLSRNLAQSVEAFDSGLAWRMYDNGASREQIARAVGCSRRGVQAMIEHGRNIR
jgi:DNA-binding transcriptional regulator LsrR (DeoR family)